MRKRSKQIIGKQLRELRNLYKLTARDIAIRCYISHANLLNIENGKQNISLGTLEKLANAYGMEITLTKRQYGIRTEKEQIEILKEIEKTGYLLSTEKDDNEKVIAYKPNYRLVYWYKDEADPELIGEFDEIEKAIAKLSTAGDSKSEEYYEPTTELLVEFIEGYIDENGTFVDSDKIIVASELTNCDINIDDAPIGIYNHQSLDRKLDESFLSLYNILEKYIKTELNETKFFYENKDNFVTLNSKGFNFNGYKTIDLIGLEDEVVDCVKVDIDRKERQVQIVVRYSKNKVINKYDLFDLCPDEVANTIKENIEDLLNNNI